MERIKVEGMKFCSYCKEWLPLANYSIDRRLKDGKQHYCKQCLREKKFAYTHGITIERYSELLELQNGRCAVCSKFPTGAYTQRNLHVDHDHKTGEIRGLLCAQCNVGIGNFRDSVELLQKAIDYLDRSKTRNRNLTLAK